MKPTKKKNENIQIRVARIGRKSAITVAVIGLLGVLLGAIINNWDDFFEDKSSQVESSNEHLLQISIRNDSNETKFTRVYDDKSRIVMEITVPPSTTTTVELPVNSYKVDIVSSLTLTQEAIQTPDPSVSHLTMGAIEIKNGTCEVRLRISGGFMPSLDSSSYVLCP